MTIHSHSAAPCPPKPKPARAPHFYGTLSALAVMLAIGVIAFGSVLHRSSQAEKELETTGQMRGPIAIAPIVDPLADTD
jgi:hypothetical protein